MPVLHVYPCALRQGDRWPRIIEAEMKETLEAAKIIVSKVSQPGSEVVLKFAPVYTLDLAEGSLPAQIQTGYGERRVVKDKLYANSYLQKMKSFNVVRVFFVWELAPVPDGKGRYAPVKGLTIDSHHLMVLGSKVERRHRPMALAHEFGHGLLGTVVHSETEGHLMYHEVEKAGTFLTPGERDTFSAHAATVAGGTSIIDPPGGQAGAALLAESARVGDRRSGSHHGNSRRALVHNGRRELRANFDALFRVNVRTEPLRLRSERKGTYALRSL